MVEQIPQEKNEFESMPEIAKDEGSQSFKLT